MKGRYEGECVEFRGRVIPHGFGKFQNNDNEGRFKYETYEGYYRYGFRHGKGFMKFSPHSIYDSYDGEWLKDLEHGFGKRVKRDSSFYEGEFEDGAQHGVGKYTYADGNVEAGVYMEGFFVCP